MVYLLLVLAMAFAGCSDWYYEAADTDYFKVKEHNLRGQYPINGRTIEGNVDLALEKSPFTPEKVLLIQLDSSLAEVDTINGENLEKDSVDYRFPSHDYKYPYVESKRQPDDALGSPAGGIACCRRISVRRGEAAGYAKVHRKLRL